MLKICVKQTKKHLALKIKTIFKKKQKYTLQKKQNYKKKIMY